MIDAQTFCAIRELVRALVEWDKENPEEVLLVPENRDLESLSSGAEFLTAGDLDPRELEYGDPRRVAIYQQLESESRKKGGIHDLFSQLGAQIGMIVKTGKPLSKDEIEQHNAGAFDSTSAGVRAGIGVERSDGELTVQRPPSETSGRMFDPLGNARSLEREAKKKTKGKARYIEGKANAPDQFDDIPLINTFGKEDALTGLKPFGDNTAPLRKTMRKKYKYSGDGSTRPTSDRAVDAVGSRQALISVSGDFEWREDDRQFLLKRVLPRLTSKQSVMLAKAFMSHDDEGVEEILELVYRTLPAMTYQRNA